eukprot:50291-Chlamydomonas_euryale.AAC.1
MNKVTIPDVLATASVLMEIVIKSRATNRAAGRWSCSHQPVATPTSASSSLFLVRLASPVTGSQVDPFDAQEAKPYKQDPEIIAMTNLVNAYQSNNINEFERILKYVGLSHAPASATLPD